MPQEVTRRRFVVQTLGVIGGATVSGDLLPLLAEAARRKQILRVAIERDFETLRPELSAGDTVNLLRRLIYTTPIIWSTKQRPDGSLIYDPDNLEMVLASAYYAADGYATRLSQFCAGLVFVAVFSPTLMILVIALSIRFVPSLVRGEILAEKVKEYAIAAQALGSSQQRLMLRHLLPNSLTPLITQSTTNISWAILNAAGLSFLGVGLQPQIPEWGVMISEGSPFIVSGQWWMSFFPGVALILMTAGFVLLGDGLSARTER